MRIILQHEYTPIEKELIENYNLDHLTAKERQLIYFHDDLETKARIVMNYRADKDRWRHEESEYRKEYYRPKAR